MARLSRFLSAVRVMACIVALAAVPAGAALADDEKPVGSSAPEGAVLASAAGFGFNAMDPEVAAVSVTDGVAAAGVLPKESEAVPFLLGPGDGLRITVWGYPELSEETTVLPDGTITCPLVGVTPAAGLTAQGLGEELRSAYEPHLIGAPQVSVVVSEMRSRRFSVIGEVSKPGTFPLWSDDMTVVEALAQAGGMGSRGLPAEVRILRANPQGERKTVSVDLSALLQADNRDVMERIQSGDVIYVPSQDTRRKVCVLGEVHAPGSYTLSPNMTVVEALTAAGWAKSSGGLGSVMVARRTGGAEPEFLRVDAQRVVKKHDWSQDIPLQPGDIIYVPERFIYAVGDFVNFFSSRVEPAAHSYLRVYDATNPASYVIDR